jgi:hypothetical protein
MIVERARMLCTAIQQVKASGVDKRALVVSIPVWLASLTTNHSVTHDYDISKKANHFKNSESRKMSMTSCFQQTMIGMKGRLTGTAEQLQEEPTKKVDRVEQRPRCYESLN